MLGRPWGLLNIDIAPLATSSGAKVSVLTRDDNRDASYWTVPNDLFRSILLRELACEMQKKKAMGRRQGQRPCAELG